MTEEGPPRRSVAQVVAEETYYYCLFGAPFTAILLILLLLFASPVAVIWGVAAYSQLAARIACFGVILWACGMPANAAFVVLMRGRLYVPGDPIVDWLPWLPSVTWIVGASDGGHYVGSATAGRLRLCWSVFALPTWTVTLLIWQNLCYR